MNVVSLLLTYRHSLDSNLVTELHAVLSDQVYVLDENDDWA